MRTFYAGTIVNGPPPTQRWVSLPTITWLSPAGSIRNAFNVPGVPSPITSGWMKTAGSIRYRLPWLRRPVEGRTRRRP